MTNREQAISDCKWALSLSRTALEQHIDSWLFPKHGSTKDDHEYHLAIREVYTKLDTIECLLK